MLEGKTETSPDQGGMPASPTSVSKATTAFKQLAGMSWGNILRNLPFLVWQWIKSRFVYWRMWFFSKLFIYRYHAVWKWREIKQFVNMKRKGIKWITADQFLKEFPPRKNHKACNYGMGYFIVQDGKTKMKGIRFCRCVEEKYENSGKKYMLRQPS